MIPNRSVAVVLLASLVALAGLGPVAAADPVGSVGDPAALDDGSPAQVAGAPAVGTGSAADGSATGPGRSVGSTIVMTHELRLAPTKPGRVTVRLGVDLPRSVTEFSVYLPADAAIVSTDGFDVTDDRFGAGDDEADLQWDGRTDGPSVTYTVAVNRTNEQFGGYDFVDTREWALVNLGDVDPYTRWRYRGEAPEFEERFSVAGEGYAGSGFAYLGPHEVYEQRGSQRFRMIVPEGTSVQVGRDAVFASLATADEHLDVGGRADAVNVFVAKPPIRGGGLTSGDRGEVNDFWAGGDAPLYRADNTWIHEYVHTRQVYNETEAMEWFDEGSAEYYAALLALWQGRAEYGSFRRHVATHDQGTLTDRSTWSDAETEYSKGSLVLAALDAEIREATDGRHTLMEVFERMNEHDGELTYRAFADIVADVAGTHLYGWLDRYVAGPEDPDMPDDPTAFTHPSGNLDPDEDGLTDAEEEDIGSNPFVADTDDDRLDDGAEVEEYGTDPTDADTDNDGLEDAVEVREYDSDPTAEDTDGDGLRDGIEVDLHDADPTETDTDGDGLDDGTEVNELGTDPTAADTDDDGIDDDAELDQHGTNPIEADTDGDGLADAAELDASADPTVEDTDGDGLDDGAEVDAGADPTVADTDDDGLADGAEVNEHGSDPTAQDTDGDGLPDGVEVNQYGADPTSTDTDGDGYPDDREVEIGTDPASETGTVGYWIAVVTDAVGLLVRPASLLGLAGMALVGRSRA